MPFGISGFGAQQTYPAPELFQALSIASAPPVPPAPPYGTPNANLVSVTLTGNPALPANLTLAAHPAFDAILKINASQSVLAFGHPPLPATPNSTSSVGATNPSVSGQIQGPTPSPNGTPASIDLPQGPVSFSLTVPPASALIGVEAVQQTVAQLQREEQQAASNGSANASNGAAANTSSSAGNASQAGDPPAGSDPAPSTGATPAAPSSGGSIRTTPAASSPGLIGRIVQTVQSLAISVVYPGPVFSFSA